MADWFTHSSNNVADLDETNQDYMRRRLPTLVQEWPEGKPCHFQVCHIEFDRTSNLKLERLRTWMYTMRSCDASGSALKGFHFAYPSNEWTTGRRLIKKIYCTVVVATPDGVFLHVQDKVELGEIQIIPMRNGGSLHRVVAITVDVATAEEVEIAHHDDPIREAERVIRSTYAFWHHDYVPRLKKVADLRSQHGHGPPAGSW